MQAKGNPNRKPLARTHLRKARQRIAKHAAVKGTKPFGATHTWVIPLQTEVSQRIWDQVRVAAQVTRGFATDTLFDLVMTAHEHGWRLFPSSGERNAYVLRGADQASGFDAAVAASGIGIEYPQLTVANVRLILGKRPRSVGAQVVTDDTDAALLAKRLAKAFGAPKALVDTPQTPMIEIATQLAEAFPKWADLVAAGPAAGRIIDAALKDAGHHLPPLAKALATDLPPTPSELGDPTIALDTNYVGHIETDPAARLACVVARYLPECGGIGDPQIPKLQGLITTVNASALSWLFGKGRRAFLTMSEEDLAAALGADSKQGKAALQALIAVQKRIPNLDDFGGSVLTKSRAALGGTLDSVTNMYVTRLAQLHNTLAEMVDKPHVWPAAYEDASVAASLYAGLPFDAVQVRESIVGSAREAGVAQQALAVLAGERAPGPGGFAAAIAQIDAYGDSLARLTGMINTINARIDADPSLDVPKLVPPLQDAHWPKVVGIREAEAEATLVIPVLSADLENTIKATAEAVDRLLTDYNLSLDDAVASAKRAVARALEIAERRGKMTAEAVARADREALARRHVLDRIVRAVRRCDNAMIAVLLGELTRQGLIVAGTASERGMKAHLYSGQLSVYAHPMSGLRNLVRLDPGAVRRFRFDELLRALAAAAKARAEERDVVVLAMLEQTLLLDGLPEQIAAASVPWLPPAQARNGVHRREDVLKGFQRQFHSPLSGLLYRLNRTTFMERFSLHCFTDTTVMLVPTPTQWTPPAQYAHGKYAAILANADLVERSASGAIDVVPTARNLTREAAKRRGEDRAALLGLLAQLPHHWAIAADFADAVALEGALVSGGENVDESGVAWVKRTGYFIQPPRHVAGELRAAYAGGKSLSPHSLMFERFCERDGISVRETSRRVTAQIPIKTTTTPAEHGWKPRHLMGIDLGEYGLGVTLLNLSNGQESTQFLPVRRIAKLSARMQHYRQRQQPRQQFKSAYNDSLEKAIDAAIGEVCGLIDDLMARYDAVPIFESEVSRARGSHVAVMRVYAGVMQRFTYIANNAAANTERSSHWFGANRWEVDIGREWIPAVRTQDAGAIKKLAKDAAFRIPNVFPGVAVSGFRTSVTCSCCGRDALGVIDQAVAGGQVALTFDEQGQGSLKVGDQTCTISIQAPVTRDDVVAAARARKQRAPWETVTGTTFILTRKGERQKLAAAIKRSMRRPAQAHAGKRSRQDQFNCVFSDCNSSLQADINASTNLVRRYRDRLEKSTHAYSAWDEPAERERITADMKEGPR